MTDAAQFWGPLDHRRAGVLLHVTSLPGGVVEFLDFLADAGCSVWQVLPLVPVHPEDGSPYNALSAMAGNPDLLRCLEDCAADAHPEQLDSWRAEQAHWLEPYVEFTVLRELADGAHWTTWDRGLRERDPDRVAQVLAPHTDRLDALRREQWRFHACWHSVREHAARRGVLIFGDLPIFVSHDSADVWAHQDLFQLDAAGQPVTVTGVPPDYFAADGQRWNNPHYDWDAMAADGYAWWRARIRRQRELFDLVRIDHFRGFEAAWHVPVEAPTARDGYWVPGPGADLLRVLVDAAGPGRLVAEDLGVITPPVDALRRQFGLPGMRVLQFAFDGDEHNLHLPEQHEELSVVYTGTHDNDTTVGWWQELDDRARNLVRRVSTGHGVDGLDGSEPMPWALIELALSSRGRLAVVPAQDLLALGSESRMNTPGSQEGNWRWRAPADAFDTSLASRLRGLVEHSDRLP